MLYICVFHSNRLNTVLPACEGRHPNGQKRLPGTESRVVPLRRGFFIASFGNNTHNAPLAVKIKTETASVTRY